MKITIENAGDISPQNLLKLADKLREMAVEIAVPEPKGIDWEAFAEKIRVFAEECIIQPKKEPPATYEEVEKMALSGFKCKIASNGTTLFSNGSSYNRFAKDAIEFPSEKLAKSARAYENLLKVMWVYNGGEITRQQTKACVANSMSMDARHDQIVTDEGGYDFFNFKTRELAELALKNFGSLFKDFYMID